MKKFKITIDKIIFGALCIFFLLIFQAVIFSSAAEANSPVITLLGKNFVSVEKGTPYVDAGATASDKEDGDLTDDIQSNCNLINCDVVNSDVAGYYVVGYRVVDKNGNSSESARLVAVFNNALPIIFTDIIAPSIPVAEPAAGYYDDNQYVSLSSIDKETGLDKIYYTTNGTVPNKTSEIYSDSIKVDRDTMTIKAIAYDKAGNKSGILEARYEINKESDDEKDDHHDSNDSGNSQEIISPTIFSNIATTNNTGADSGEEIKISNESTEKVDGEGSSSVQTNNEKQGEVAGTETANDSSSNSIWWWIIGIIILLGIIAVVFGIKDKENQTR